ncbi:MAG: ATP-binding cassette domain-containing protein, partial [Planctomycetes bacterium]|nr:ATP-binding cassette domain-containing protein [Planctomycetota bacterium]
LLINAVVHAIVIHAGKAPDRTVLSFPLLWGSLRSPVLTSFAAVVVLALIQLVIAAVSSLLQTVSNISQQLLQERVSMSVQLMIMEHASALDLTYFEDAQSYDTLQQAQREATTRPVQMVSGVFGLVRTALTFLTMIALLVGVSPLLALVALLAPVPSFISDARYGWRGYAIARWNSPIRRRMAYYLTLLTTDTFAKEIKLMTLSKYFITRFRELAQGYYDDQRGLVTRRYLAGFAWGSLSTIASSGTYLFVALQAVAGRLTLGDLTLYTQAATSVQSSFQGLLSGFSSMYENNLYLTSLFDLLKEKPHIRAPEHPLPVPRPLSGAIEFDNVSFTYEGSDRNALRDVSFVINPGETIAIVGRNGAGKTTLIKLLARLYDPTSGRVLIDGYDVRDFDPDELRQHIGVMFQDYVNYQATARENIGFGRVEHMDDAAAVTYAAERSGASEAIEKLPDTYETMLGKWFDEGYNLSGGEWQKVALARAFMRDARILILDEPTSAITQQEVEVLFGLIDQLKRQGVGLLYITHKLDELPRIADDVTILRDGHFIEACEVGALTHDEMVRKMVGRDPSAFFRKEPHPPGPEVLRVEGMTLPHPERPGDLLVDGVSFSVRRGEVLGIFGLLGAGRTELLEAIFGLHPGRATGRIEVEGRPVAIRGPRQAIAAGLALAPEDRQREGLVLSMSVAENASLASLEQTERVGFLDPARERELVGRLTARLKVKTPSLAQRVRYLSGGNQQKVVLARWLAIQPRVLLLDEPTRGIDIGARKEIYALIEELARAGLAVVLVSSDMPEVLALADRILVLSEGRKTAEFARAEATEEAVLKAALPRTNSSEPTRVP